MKYNIFFTIRSNSTLKVLEDVPNNQNPVSCDSLQELLKLLSNSLLPWSNVFKVIGIRIEEIK